MKKVIIIIVAVMGFGITTSAQNWSGSVNVNVKKEKQTINVMFCKNIGGSQKDGYYKFTKDGRVVKYDPYRTRTYTTSNGGTMTVKAENKYINGSYEVKGDKVYITWDNNSKVTCTIKGSELIVEESRNSWSIFRECD